MRHVFTVHWRKAKRNLRWKCSAAVVFAALVVLTVTAIAGKDDNDDNGGGRGGFCSQTANLLFRACGNEAQDGFFVASAKCTNVSDQAERTKCLADATTARNESRQLCGAQRTGRLDACKLLGEGRYDPNFDSALFDDPKNPTHPNPYFPLKVDNKWEFAGKNESDVVEVVDETKLIDGVTCIVVRDQVSKDGDLAAEDTDDWYAQAKDGNTWYCGEEVKNFESFDGDNPKRLELVKIDGSFKAGREGDKPGIIFQASPTVGKVYLEEFALGNAEDVTQILSAT